MSYDIKFRRRTIGYDRYYDTRKTAFDNLTAFENDTFTLFPQLGAVQTAIEAPEIVQAPPAQLSLFPSVGEQMALIKEAEQLELAAIPVTITQEDIDNALRQWNGTLDSKILVHEYMRENARAKDTANFLKTEFEQYGGEMPVFTVVKDGAEAVTLPWAKVQRRIGQLMESEQFLTPEELVYADREWNDSREDNPEQEAAQSTAVQELYRYYYRTTDTLPIDGTVETHSPDEAEQLIFHDNYVLLRVELASEPEKPIVVAPTYAIGDTVYLEDDRRFIIENITDREVKLLDPSLYIPITRAMSIGEFERKFYRNPKNEAELPLAEVASQPEPESTSEVVSVPQQTAENFRITDTHLGEGGAKTKYGYNIAALKLLKELEAYGRNATSDEQEILSRYVGWGGLP